ncbi:N-acetylmuramoyl-L-alanine amidase [Antricoccus suffuscus]|uniref:N-acetylmuramoyl-L-alanine amidase n=1 Tax=Antricoccus suffuscus TaxID=1629062 RepID=A0A2T1A320_9ACTN|nr:N-acetylmuramoyl-L-alanine amidase [Antricoccus suffuscus]PRZ43009.1 N-acetylmuramoyl-L-alanine amidase [Antricoccus suffuscus]
MSVRVCHGLATRARTAAVAGATMLAVTLAVSGCMVAATPDTAGKTSSSSTPRTSIADPSTPAPSTTTSSTTAPTPTPAATPSPTPAAPAPPPPNPLAGKVVVIDPGHNGANGANSAAINKQVPDGTGGTKACNTTGTATNDGYAEHAFTWDLSAKLKAILESNGVTVVLTRQDDNGIGPCVNVRAQIGNDAHANAVVSIHGDGSAAGNHGFFCMTTALAPGGEAIKTQSSGLAGLLRDAVVASGVMPVANYEGTNGVDGSRSDLAGLNLSTVPTTMCELGNMRSDIDSAIQKSDTGRAKIAAGLASGVLAYLAE